jgi:uncharacterized membrane-anchored protein
MKILQYALAGLALFLCLTAGAQETDSQAQLKQFMDSLHYRDGTVAISAAHATVNLNSDFRFLDAHDAQRVLHDLWGNPPDEEVLGMLVPRAASLTDEDNSWVVVVTYSSDGHVADADAGSIDYDKMLKEMKESENEVNAEREKQGYPAVELVGWAAPPHYDAASNKLYWAKELAFRGGKEHTLNYDIRVLGRGGYLSLNAVAGMHQLAMVRDKMPDVLAMTEFDSGQRYSDFDSSTDKVAAYGIGALVAGAIAAKAGLFAKLFVLLLAFKKFVIVGFIAVAAALRKFYTRAR